ncbi:MAG: ABC transporter permease [Chloroflexi bacterium]|nr:ABC transporter permease [Chloroflexota bacterium]
MAAFRGPLWFLARRLGTVSLTLLGLVTIVFAMTKVIPGDEAQVAAGAGATPEQVQRMRVQLGLDQPVLVQYGRYVGRLVQGDLGTSVVSHRPVRSDIGAVLPATAQLVILSLALALAVSIPLASLAALQSGAGSATASRVMVIVAAGLPTFWLALVLQWVLGSWLRLLPISGTMPVGTSVPPVTGMTVLDALLAADLGLSADAVRHLILPAGVLAVHAGAQFYRLLRAEMLAVLQREHILVAQAKGVPMTRLVVAHALPNALGPVLTQLGIQVGFMVGSAVLVESVFSLPGVGSYLFYAVEQRDIFAVLGAVLTIGVIVVVANFTMDVVQLWRDPRIRAAQIGGR